MINLLYDRIIMHKLLIEKSAEINNLCQRYNVKTLHVYGSVVRSDFDPSKSDLDFLVEFLPQEPTERAACFFGLDAALRTLFDRPIDLGELEGIRNDRFRKIVNASKVAVYAAA